VCSRQVGGSLRKTLVISELENFTLMEEISWRQKSRALWLKEGDKCIKRFHWVANLNSRNNSIEALLVNDSVSSDQSAIREHIVQYYDSLLSEQLRWQPKLDGLAFDSLDVKKASRLESSLEESEVLGVVKGMNRVIRRLCLMVFLWLFSKLARM
jgi:hypothetical protein